MRLIDAFSKFQSIQKMKDFGTVTTENPALSIYTYFIEFES